MDREEKFIEKNKENIEQLNKFIDDILCIVAEIGLVYFLLNLPDAENIVENNYEPLETRVIKYKKKLLYSNMFYLPGRISFIRKSECIDFCVPCIGGIYCDEKHP